jgi:hypothetical protein
MVSNQGSGGLGLINGNPDKATNTHTHTDIYIHVHTESSAAKLVGLGSYTVPQTRLVEVGNFSASC